MQAVCSLINQKKIRRPYKSDNFCPKKNGMYSSEIPTPQLRNRAARPSLPQLHVAKTTAKVLTLVRLAGMLMSKVSQGNSEY